MSLQTRGDGGEPACKGEGTEKLGRAKTEEMEKEQIYQGLENENGWVSRISGTDGDRSMGCAQTNRNMKEKTQM